MPRNHVHAQGAARDDSDSPLQDGDRTGSFEIYLGLLMKEHEELRHECALLRAQVKDSQTAESPDADDQDDEDDGGFDNASAEAVDAGFPVENVPSTTHKSVEGVENVDPGRSHFTKLKAGTFMNKYKSISVAGGAGLFPFKGAKRIKDTLKWVRNPNFSFAVTGVIVLNAIYIAVYSSVVLHKTRQRAGKIELAQKEMWILGDAIFALIFTSEVVLRIFAYQIKFFKGSQWLWNAFDCLTLVATLVALTSDIVNAPPNFYVNFFKMLRLARLVRSLKASKSPYLHTLKMLMYTVAGSANAFLSALLLLVIVISVFGVFFMQGLQNYLEGPRQHPETRRQLEEHFGTFRDAAFTLLSCITGGLEWGELSPALESIDVMYKYFLVVYITFAVLCMLNILNGVFVNAAIESAQSNKELAVETTHHKMMGMIEQAVKWFVEADKDGSGKLSWEELRDVMRDDEVRTFMLASGIDVASAGKIFQLLDTDGSGSLSPEEFVDNLITLQGNAKAIDVASLREVCVATSRSVKDLEAALRERAPRLESRASAARERQALSPRQPLSPRPVAI